MPYLDLSSQNLLAGIHQKVKKQMKPGSANKGPMRQPSVVSSNSNISAFTIEDNKFSDDDSDVEMGRGRNKVGLSSPTNVRFTSMQ